VQGPECQSLMRLVRDDTSSLLLLGPSDSESIGTYKSTGPQTFRTINTTFGFDTEVTSSKAYRTATRTSMLRTMWLDGTATDQPSVVESTLGPPTRQLESGSHALRKPNTDNPGVSNTPSSKEHHPRPINKGLELQGLASPTALSICTIYTLETLKRLHTVPSQPRMPSLKNTRPLRIRQGLLVARRWLANPSNPPWANTGETIGSQVGLGAPAVKVLVLGTSESGKSTLIKSISEKYVGAYDEEDRRTWRPIILFNLYQATELVAEALADQGEATGNISQQMRDDIRTLEAAYDLIKLGVDEYYRRDSASADIPVFSLPPGVLSAIRNLWKRTRFHQVLEKAVHVSSIFSIDAANW
jgi:hypothetical protein